jgi:hypothetical protein
MAAAAMHYCCYRTQLMELLKNNDSIRDERERARKVYHLYYSVKLTAQRKKHLVQRHITYFDFVS